jgi:hypothetical protein
MRCRDAAASVTHLHEGGLSPIGTFRVQRHLAQCAQCRTYAGQLEASASASRLLANEPLDPAHEALAMSTFRAWQKRRANLPSEDRAYVSDLPGHARIIAAIGLGSIASIAIAQHRAPFGLPWILAGVLTLLACALVPLTRKRGLVIAATCVAVAALPILFAQQRALTWLVHMPCVLHELATAGIALAALWTWHKDRASRSPSTAAGVAALGALAGDASLHVVCESASSFAHLLVFHVGGVALAAAVAAIIAARLLAPRGALS